MEKHIGQHPNIEIIHNSIFNVDYGALVTPKNWFGFVDEGLNLAVEDIFYEKYEFPKLLFEAEKDINHYIKLIPPIYNSKFKYFQYLSQNSFKKLVFLIFLKNDTVAKKFSNYFR